MRINSNIPRTMIISERFIVSLRRGPTNTSSARPVDCDEGDEDDRNGDDCDINEGDEDDCDGDNGDDCDEDDDCNEDGSDNDSDEDNGNEDDDEFHWSEIGCSVAIVPLTGPDSSRELAMTSETLSFLYSGYSSDL